MKTTSHSTLVPKMCSSNFSFLKIIKKGTKLHFAVYLFDLQRDASVYLFCKVTPTYTIVRWDIKVLIISHLYWRHITYNYKTTCFVLVKTISSMVRKHSFQNKTSCFVPEGNISSTHTNQSFVRGALFQQGVNRHSSTCKCLLDLLGNAKHLVAIINNSRTMGHKDDGATMVAENIFQHLLLCFHIKGTGGFVK